MIDSRTFKLSAHRRATRVALAFVTACIANGSLFATPSAAQLVQFDFGTTPVNCETSGTCSRLHQGRVAARGMVLRTPGDNGEQNVSCTRTCDYSTGVATCSSCTGGLPTWVEYNENNTAIRNDAGAIIFNAPEDAIHHVNAFVISATDYRRLTTEVADAARSPSGEPRSADGLTCRSGGQDIPVASLTSLLSDGGSASTQTFNPKVRTVIVRSGATAPLCSDILFASPLNAQMLNKPSQSGIQTMLLDQDSWTVLWESIYRIGLETSFLTFGATDSPPAKCVDNFDSCPPNTMWAQTGNKKQELRVWSPIRGVTVQIPSGYNYVSATSGIDGYYEMRYRLLTDPIAGLYQFPVSAKMIFQNNNPRSASANAFVMNGLVKYDAYTGTSYKNFAVDVSLLSGTASIQNPSGSGVNLVGITSYTQASGIKSYNIVDYPTLYDYQSYGIDSSGVGYAEGGLRDQGLLKNINVPDLRNTEIYVYRMSDGRFVGSRWGLAIGEVGPTGAAATPTSADPLIRYSALMRGPKAAALTTGASQVLPANTLTLDSDFKEAGDFLRAGDLIKVVAINRSTGYLGTAIGQLTQDASGQTMIMVNHIAMQPPNLRVRVERSYKVAQGASQASTATTPRTQIIGFEGSGLTSDQLITVTTEWFDENGQPLPENLPGYTGRLVRVVDGSAEDADSVPQVPGGPAVALKPIDAQHGAFSITPNQSVAIIQLPSDAANQGHFYLHIVPQPIEREVAFAGSGTIDKPSYFSVNAACYQTDNGWSCVPRSPDRYDTDQQALKQRPVNYVPFKTAIYQKGSGSEPGTYQWVYRPEMQFSILSMEAQNLYRKEEGQPLDVLNTQSVLRSSDGTIQLLYGLKEDANGPLSTFGPNRTLAFEFQGKIYNAQLVSSPGGQASTITFTGVDQPPPGISAEDLLTIRLVQRGDEGNVLWEYEFNDIRIVLEEGRACIPRGDSVLAFAKIQPPDADVDWTIEKQDKGVKVTPWRLDPHTRVRLTATEDTERGYITLRATMVKNGVKLNDTYARAKIFVGCRSKSEESAGQCETSSDGVNANFTLGDCPGGGPAGQISIEADRPTEDTCTPKGLRVATTSLDTRPVYSHDDGSLRQVDAPETFVDVVRTGISAYELRFYPPGAKGEVDATTGIYVVKSAASPQAVWRIENPAGGSGAPQRVRITGVRPDMANADVREYEFLPGEPMRLKSGDGARIEERTQTETGSDHVRRVVVKDGAGIVASVVQQKFRTFSWGDELVSEVRDPDGEALTTTKAYYETIDPGFGSYTGQVASIQNPDGSWVRYYYDSYGRVVTEVRPWLSATITAPESQSRVLRYDYAALDSGDGGTTPGHQDYRQPRTTTELIQGTVVRKTFNAIVRATDESRTTIEERCVRQNCAYGDADNLRTETRFYPEDTADPQGNDTGRLQSVRHPDGTLDSYTYTRGSVTNRIFTSGAGNAMRMTVTHGTVSSPAGVPFKSTREVSLTDSNSNLILNERYVYTGTGYELLDSTAKFYENDRLIRTERSNGEVSSATWGASSENVTTDSRGIKTEVLARDSMQRVLISQCAGITTSYTYDADGRKITVTRSGGGLNLSISNSYDTTGRLFESMDESGLVTQYAYANGGRQTLVIRPGGFTEQTDQYLDGRQMSVTGSAVVPQYSTYSVNADGTRVTEVRLSRPDSPVFERTYTDMLGRTVRVERPGFNGGTQVTQTFYNAQGQVARTRTTGLADKLYAYDELGRQIRSGLDVDGSSQLDLVSADRIQESETYFNSIGGQWWQEQQQRVYADPHSSSPTVTGTSRTRLTGLGGGLISEQVSVDLQGNETRTTVNVDPSQRTETNRTDVPDSAQDAIVVSVDGRQISSSSATGVTTTFDYDGLGRGTGVTDPRTGRSQTHYDSVTGRVDYVRDAAGDTTSFGYEGATGRKISETNALGKSTYFAYDARGQLVRTWGQVPYPVEYVYDEYERRTEMHTFRAAGLNFSATTWPDGASVTADETRWVYDEATGLLAQKQDAAGKATQFSYDAAGRLATRTWARPKGGGGALVTAYGYDGATGELTSIDYNDGTPDVAYSYDRLGRPATVSDGAGGRTFAYDPNNLQLLSETMTGLEPAVLTRSYDTSNVKGRPVGITLGSGYAVAYGYDTLGRFNNVSFAVNGVHDSTTYGYVQSSGLLSGVTTQTGQSTTYTYEAQRDLKTQVQNKFGSTLVSQYDYAYDAVGRRTSLKNSGTAFAQAAFSKWGYDDRNELSTSDRYLGTNITDLSQPVNAAQRAYAYDPIGNRKTSTAAGVQTSYVPNALNEYSTVGSASSIYDDDGNLLNDGTRIFSYNAENQLVSVTVPQSSVSTYVYDYLGRRVRKIINQWNGTGWVPASTISFVYDEWSLIRETTSTSPGISSVDFVHGIGTPIAAIDNAGNKWQYMVDGTGSVVQVLDTAGNPVATYEYDVYGDQIAATGSHAAENRFRFKAIYLDSETGLYDYGKRFYSPAIGRWLNRDSIEEEGGLNLYTYVLNSPLVYGDLIGNEPYVSGELQYPTWTAHPRTGKPSAADYSLYSGALAQLPAMGFLSIPARNNFQHYLKGGGTAQKVNFGNVIADESEKGFSRVLIADLEDAINHVEKAAPPIEGGLQLQIKDKLRSQDWTGRQLQTTTWLFALGNVLWSGAGEMDANAGCNTLRLKYYVWDPYDFEYEDVRGGFFTSRQYRHLHDVGLASEYLITGETEEIEVRWTRGKHREIKETDVKFRTGGVVEL